MQLVETFGCIRITPHRDRRDPPSSFTPQICEKANFEHEAEDLAYPHPSEVLLYVLGSI